MRNFFSWMRHNPKFTAMASSSTFATVFVWCLIVVQVSRGEPVFKVIAVCLSLGLIIMVAFLAVVFEVYLDATDLYNRK